jgi:uncharacterized repeat protein (TIGR03806 family)
MLLAILLATLNFFPDVVGPGIDTPQPIGPYLNGAFPDLAPSTMATNVNYGIENAFPNLTFIDPLDLAELPDDRLMVIGKPGFVWVFDNDPGVSTKTLVLDISAHTILSGDSGLLGLCLHPDFAANGYFYLWYRYTPVALSENSQGYMRLQRFRLQYDGNGNPFVDNADPEYVLIQQYDTHHWHNGGGMFFGPDGFLYIAVGDQGGANDQFNNTQRIDQWLFSGVFRIDVDMQGGSVSHPIGRQPLNPSTPPSGWPNSYTQNYYIPNDNPWAGSGGAYLEEFFSLGTRSPHRMTYDPVDDEIWIGDIGQSTREEISVIDRGLVLSGSNGANLQWPYREGNIAGQKAKPSPLIGYDNPPVFDYPRSFGNCVIGGYMIRNSTKYPELEGKYLFSDHAVQNVWTLEKDPGGGAPSVEFLLNVPFEGQGSKAGISSFGMTSDGTVYILDLFGSGLDGGKIHKLVRTAVGSVPEPPELLSEVLAFSDLDNLVANPGLIPYDVNAKLWSDRALKQRWIAIPNDGTHNSPKERIVFDREDNWQFPPGTVAVKHFELPVDERDPALTTRLETRFLIFDKEGGAYGVTYRWNENGTEAYLLRDGETRDVAITRMDGTQFIQTWEFPNRQQCMSCHNNVAGYGLGLKTRQMNLKFTYPGGVTDNQLATWNHLGIFNQDIGDAGQYPQNASLSDVNASEEFRIRSYMDGNCSFCHRSNGVAGVFDARGLTALHDQQLINAEVISSSSPAGGMVIKPGLHGESVLWQRDNSLGADAMPPIAKNVLDEEYIQLLTNWIDDLGSNAPVQLDEGWYQLEMQHSGLLLAGQSGHTYHNALIDQQANLDADHQQWFAANVGGNKYSFINQASELCLAIEQLQAGEGAQLVQQNWTGAQHQLWYVEQAPAGHVVLKSAYNGLNITISGADMAENSLAVTALPDASAPAQQISLIPLSGEPIVFNPASCQSPDYQTEVLPQCRYTLKFYDSEETGPEDGAARNAIDHDPATIWHTQWATASPAHPHEIQLEMETVYEISALRYLPRQAGAINGTVAAYEVYLSLDGANWGAPVATGTWANNRNWKEAVFSPQKARYVRLRALSEVNGNPWTSAAEIEVVASACLSDREVIGESGLISVDHNWQTVSLLQTYQDPVVVAGGAGYSDPTAVSVRVRNVLPGSFEIRLEEWDCSDGTHPAEQVPYVVMEAGIHKLMDGSTITAANEAAVTNAWHTVTFSKPFTTSPVIFAQCSSTNESSPIVSRIDHTLTNQNQFRVRLQEGSLDQNAPHAAESLGWIALEPGIHNGHFSFESGSTGVSVDQNVTTIPFAQCYTDPVFLSGLGSYYGSDPSGMRFLNIGSSSVDVFVEEEVCSDAEVAHGDENVFYWVFNQAGLIYGNTMSLLHIKAYLQGAWNGSEMTTGLSDAGLLPLMQPYSEVPWHYDGNECVSVIPPNAVDWVLVQIRHEADRNRIIAQRACFVRKDGILVDLDGTEGVYFNKVDIKNGYVSIVHRNHLGVATQLPVSLR